MRAIFVFACLLLTVAAQTCGQRQQKYENDGCPGVCNDPDCEAQKLDYTLTGCCQLNTTQSAEVMADTFLQAASEVSQSYAAWGTSVIQFAVQQAFGGTVQTADLDTLAQMMIANNVSDAQAKRLMTTSFNFINASQPFDVIVREDGFCLRQGNMQSCCDDVACLPMEPVEPTVLQHSHTPTLAKTSAPRRRRMSETPPCSIGTYAQDGACVQASAGYYVPEADIDFQYTCPYGRETINANGEQVVVGATRCRPCSAGWYDADRTSSTPCVFCRSGHETRRHIAAEDAGNPSFCSPNRWLPDRCAFKHPQEGWEWWPDDLRELTTAQQCTDATAWGTNYYNSGFDWHDGECPERGGGAGRNQSTCIEADYCDVVNEGAQFCDACEYGKVDHDSTSSTACVDADSVPEPEEPVSPAPETVTCRTGEYVASDNTCKKRGKCSGVENTTCETWSYAECFGKQKCDDECFQHEFPAQLGLVWTSKKTGSCDNDSPKYCQTVTNYSIISRWGKKYVKREYTCQFKLLNYVDKSKGSSKYCKGNPCTVTDLRTCCDAASSSYTSPIAVVMVFMIALLNSRVF